MTDATAERWLTYEEAGQLLGCTANAARMHAKRRGWLHRAPNMIGGRATVLVPNDLVVRPVLQHSAAVFDGNVQEEAHNGAATERALSVAVSTLHEALTAERARTDRAEEERRAVQAKLDDVRAAERIARDEAAGLRAELEARKQWGLWRRMRGR
jgi:hypothetical protein